MDEIAAQAKVSKATLYRYYPTKESLFAAVLSELPVARFEPPPSLGGRPKDVLSDLGIRILDSLCDPAYQDLMKVTLAERARFPELTAAFLDRVIGRGVRLMTGLFASEVTKGGLRKLDPSLAAQEFVGMLLAFALMQGFSPRPWKHDHDQVVRQAVEVFLLGSTKKSSDRTATKKVANARRGD
jgi:AcrR family transcriptional regulator